MVNIDRYHLTGGVPHTHEELFPELTLGKFKNQLSDHLPLWLEVDTWIDDELLDGFLAD